MMMFLVSFLVLAVCIAGMALGVILSNKPLKGSCGGLDNVMGEECDICGKKDECEDRLKRLAEIEAT